MPPGREGMAQVRHTRGMHASRPHASARHARHTLASSSWIGSTRGASTRRATTSGCGAVAPAVERQRVGAGDLARDVQQLLAPRVVQRRAGGEPQRAERAVAGPAARAVQQRGVGGGRAAALEPARADGDVVAVVAGHERRVGGRQAQRDAVPAEHLGARRELEAHAVVGVRAGVHQRLERQPLQAPPPATRAWTACAARAPALR